MRITLEVADMYYNGMGPIFSREYIEIPETTLNSTSSRESQATYIKNYAADLAQRVANLLLSDDSLNTINEYMKENNINPKGK